MFAVGLDRFDICPQMMKFQGWWIYNFQSCHPFWLDRIRKDYAHQLIFSPTAWEALMQAYQLSLFSPLPHLKTFSTDYHQFFKTRVSNREIEKTFQHFHHLGLDKIGHLKKLPYFQIRKRFGKAWSDFLHGLVEPYQQEWPWQKFQELSPIESHIQFDFAVCEAEPVLQAIFHEMNRLSSQNFFFHQLSIQFISLESDQDRSLEIEFPSKSSIQKDLDWIKKITQERLLSVELLAPLSGIRLCFHPNPPRESVQLSLFQDLRSAALLQELQNKLKIQGYEIFMPQITNALVPEQSWRKSEIHTDYQPQEKSIFRPLIQFQPRPILPPEAKLYPTEHLEWIDEAGQLHRRHYYLCRGTRKWIWVFEDESENWFEQGIVE